ncbi:MAG: hypothetical protein ACLTYN_08330 [Dysosmobacter welbionis]
MKIVVLAGGISTERAVSLVTGTGVCRALRENGHRAILVDLFLGLEEVPADLETLFDAPDGLCPDAKIEVEAPDLETVKRGRKDQGPSHIGPHVLDICQKADLVFLGLHVWMGGRPHPGRPGFTGRALHRRGSSAPVAMDKAVSARPWTRAAFHPKWRLLSHGLDERSPWPRRCLCPASSRPSGRFVPACTYRRTGRS